MFIEHPVKELVENFTTDNQHRPREGYRYTREMTIEEILLDNRVVFLIGPVNYATCTLLVMRLLYLDNLKRTTDIHLYINSLGGNADDMLAIYDTIQFISSDVCTYCIGTAMSAAAVILAAGTKGKRFALPHSRIMIHQGSGGMGGPAADIKIQAKEYLRLKATINQILAKHTGQPIEKITADCERDRFMAADEAQQYGLIDEVLHEEEDDKKKQKGNKKKNNK